MTNERVTADGAVRIELFLSRETLKSIDTLTESALYGINRSETIRHLLASAIRRETEWMINLDALRVHDDD